MGRRHDDVVAALPEDRRKRVGARFEELRNEVESLGQLRRAARKAQAEIASASRSSSLPSRRSRKNREAVEGVAKAGSNPDPAYQEKLAHYDRLVATVPDVERRGAANPYTAVNGHMFSYLHPSGRMALRLPPDEREAFLAAYGATLFEAYGVVQKEYVTVPPNLLADTEKLRAHFLAGFEYVGAMKPKPTKGKNA